jgi:UDP-N-acetylmuramoylalanine--D-glutamate ligase
VLAALRGFESVVLIAGGRNKGLDLGVLSAEAGRIRAVVAIGEAAGDVERAFSGIRPVTVAGSMAEAVERAASLAEPGDVVLLSPGCASFDWYGSYAERGDDFTRCVRQLTGAPA